jgi:glycosyltransferase involved in cell wall biosynthesis
MNCSVIIRCLNEERHLARLLKALECQTLRPSQIIVVDSGSTDTTVQIAHSLGAQVVHINPWEFSFGRSLNSGARVAGGEILVIASAHSYPVSESWLESLLRPFKDPNVALVYGGQRGDHRSKFSETQLFKQWFPSESSENQSHSFCNNANAAVRRSVWLTMPYDEQVPALEDIHWAKRALERGFRIVYQADAAIVHVHQESYVKVYRRYRREGMGLRMIFPWEHMRLRQAVALAASAIRSDLHEARAEGVLRRKFQSILCFRAAQYWGTYRGLRWHGTLTSDLRARMYYPKGYLADATHTVSDAKPDAPLSAPVSGKRTE